MIPNPTAGLMPVTSEFTTAFTIAPSDSTDLSQATRAILVTASGTVVADFLNGSTNIALGTLAVGVYPFVLRRVRATGTSATVLGLY